jgi:hypothetical protein
MCAWAVWELDTGSEQSMTAGAGRKPSLRHDGKQTMNLHFVKLVMALPLALALAGCQTIPLTEPVGTAFTSSTPEKARIRITEFPIPKDEPGAKLFHLMVLVGGGQVNYPVGASIYDVTDETRYLGNLVLDGVSISRNTVEWLEYALPPGRRTLMLVEAPPANAIAVSGGGPLRQVDFIEIDARPGSVKHIALTRHGIMNKPYLGEIKIAEADQKSCESLTSSSEESRERWKERLERINAYMAAQGIDEYARDFRVFCHMLSAPKRILVPSAEAMKQYTSIKTEIEAARAAGYEKWKAEGTAQAPYDLMKSYQPVTAESP